MRFMCTKCGAESLDRVKNLGKTCRGKHPRDSAMARQIEARANVLGDQGARAVTQAEMALLEALETVRAKRERDEEDVQAQLQEESATRGKEMLENTINRIRKRVWDAYPKEKCEESVQRGKMLRENAIKRLRLRTNK